MFVIYSINIINFTQIKKSEVIIFIYFSKVINNYNFPGTIVSIAFANTTASLIERAPDFCAISAA